MFRGGLDRYWSAVTYILELAVTYISRVYGVSSQLQAYMLLGSLKYYCYMYMRNTCTCFSWRINFASYL